MRHYIPLQTATGWAVAYQNHRGEFVAVLECPTLESAYSEAVEMTTRANHQAAQIIAAHPDTGNRYLRRYA